MFNKTFQQMASLVSGAFLFFSLHGCADEIVTADDLKNGQSNTAQLAKLSEIQKQIFTPTCATSGCHGSSGTQAGLNLTEGRSYNSLVNVNSVLYPNLKRVVPGKSSESLLIQVLNHTSPTKMPPGGKLEQSQIDSIAAWIDKGALNN